MNNPDFWEDIYKKYDIGWDLGGPTPYFSNIAMKLAKTLEEKPFEIAERIMSAINTDGKFKIWIAKPGYINFTLNQSQKINIIQEIIKSENLLTDVKTEDVKKVIVEFVSANPTGPLHVGHGRGAIYGNIISKYLEIQGHKVHKEYYVNDYGNQISKLVISVFSRLDVSIAQNYTDLYEGDYINDISYLKLTGRLKIEKNKNIYP